MHSEEDSKTNCDNVHDSYNPLPSIRDSFVFHSSKIPQVTKHSSRFKCWRQYPSRIHFLIIFIFLPITCQAFCPSKCVCDDNSLQVQCTNASLEMIPFLLNPQTQSLSLPCNNIGAIEQSLVFYPDLKNVDLSYNHIKSIEIQDFEAQKNLRVLNLNKNRLKSIQNRSFVPLVELRELYLSSNILTLIEPNSFDNVNELRVLDLSNNKLKVFSDTTFSELHNLKVLKLNYNYFAFVPSNAINKLQSLKEIELTGNMISEVPSSAFQALSNLTSISLDKNNISAIYPESFEGLDQLESLSMKDNRLSTIDGQLFQSLTSLQNLDLSGNLFQELDKAAFPPLSSLLHLRLTRCPRLYRIDSEAFVNLRSLETLQLSHNTRLIYLGDSTFSSLAKLRDLDLTACGLIYVHPNQMPQNSETTLHLAGNPLHCNCSLLWLASLPYNDSFYLDAPTCATPPNLYGIPVNKVDLRAAGCNHHLGLAAIGTCIGVVLLGLLVIAVFLAWRWRKRTLSTTKTLPGVTDMGIREPWGGGGTIPQGQLTFQGTQIYLPKYCIHSQVTQPSCGHTQCQGGCHGVTQPPYSLHPVTRPLLTPPSPSLTNHSHLPVDWLYPSPYDDDTHWYTTIGRDGREYLTGELKRDHPTPPPLPKESPPPHPALPPSSPNSARLKKGITSVGQHTPVMGKHPHPPSFVMQEGVPVTDRPRVPVTYI